MGRARRIQLPGVTFHVVQRGHNRAQVFFSDEDFRDYLLLLNRVSEMNATDVHAYVLMSNHVHLLMTSAIPDGISRTMQQVAGTYSRRRNESRRRTGALWEGRFRSSPVDSERYCLTCYRYIELNPVRAGMVASPAEYRWSSNHENTGRGELRIVKPHACFIALGPTTHERARRYCQIMRGHLSGAAVAQIRSCTDKCMPIGERRFLQRIETLTGTQVGPRKRGRPKKGV